MGLADVFIGYVELVDDVVNIVLGQGRCALLQRGVLRLHKGGHDGGIGLNGGNVFLDGSAILRQLLLIALRAALFVFRGIIGGGARQQEHWAFLLLRILHHGGDLLSLRGQRGGIIGFKALRQDCAEGINHKKQQKCQHQYDGEHHDRIRQQLLAVELFAL